MHPFFQALFNPKNDSEQHTDPQSLRLASAVLLFETIRADGTLDAAETQALISLLQRRWQLDAEAAAAFQESLQTKAENAADLQQFTRLLCNNWDYEQRVELIANMWMLAYSDQHLDPQEEYTIRKVADLLYVDHKDFIRAKIRALNTADN